MTEQTQQSKTGRGALAAFLVIGVLLVAIVAVVSLRGTFGAAAPTPTPVPPPAGVTSIDPPRELADFTLPGSSGQPLSLSDLQGKFTLLFFGYTHCPDICPLTLAHWKSIRAKLGDDAAQMNFLFISVDGGRDTPEVMAQYLSRFDPTFIGMSGDDATLARIGGAYGLYYQLHTEEGENYSVDHTSQSYLINPQGQMIDMFSYDTAEDAVVQTIESEIAQASA